MKDQVPAPSVRQSVENIANGSVALARGQAPIQKDWNMGEMADIIRTLHQVATAAPQGKPLHLPNQAFGLW